MTWKLTLQQHSLLGIVSCGKKYHDNFFTKSQSISFQMDQSQGLDSIWKFSIGPWIQFGHFLLGLRFNSDIFYWGLDFIWTFSNMIRFRHFLPVSKEKDRVWHNSEDSEVGWDKWTTYMTCPLKFKMQQIIGRGEKLQSIIYSSILIMITMDFIHQFPYNQPPTNM